MVQLLPQLSHPSSAAPVQLLQLSCPSSAAQLSFSSSAASWNLAWNGPLWFATKSSIYIKSYITNYHVFFEPRFLWNFWLSSGLSWAAVFHTIFLQILGVSLLLKVDFFNNFWSKFTPRIWRTMAPIVLFLEQFWSKLTPRIWSKGCRRNRPSSTHFVAIFLQIPGVSLLLSWALLGWALSWALFWLGTATSPFPV